MKKSGLKYIFLLSILLAWCVLPAPHTGSTVTETPPVGVWVTVFSQEKVFSSIENADRMIQTCKRSGIQQIYLQVYRADKAYYDSEIADRTSYEKILKSAGRDPIKYILSRAKENGIEVYAWMNMLSIAHNKNAGILKKLTDSALTRDKHGRTPLRKGNKDALDDYYVREDQLFLEPGDKRVRLYLVSIAREILTKYPGFDGLHLDYIRYPAVTPITPGSRFDSHGISYGYGQINSRNFKDATGLDIKTMGFSAENCKKWDDWRRQNVTELVRDVSKETRAISPDLKLSCTIVPSIMRTYLVTFQDWTRWLKEDLIDYVTAMNYTTDPVLMELNSSSLLIPQIKDRIYIGMGAYLLKRNTDAIEEQLEILEALHPGGIVIFSYDDVADNESLQKFIAEQLK